VGDVRGDARGDGKVGLGPGSKRGRGEETHGGGGFSGGSSGEDVEDVEGGAVPGEGAHGVRGAPANVEGEAGAVDGWKAAGVRGAPATFPRRRVLTRETRDD